MGPIFALMLVATPVCQWTGTNWDPGVVVNAPDGQPLFELRVNIDRATARLGPASIELELEDRVVHLTGRLPADATLFVAPRKPLELNAVMRLEPGGWAFAGSRRGLILPEALRRPDGSAWAPIAVACAQVELSLGKAVLEGSGIVTRLLKAAPHVEEGFVFPGWKFVTKHQPLDFSARPGGPIVVRVMPLLPTLATVMAKKGSYLRLRFIVGGVRVDGWIRDREDAFGRLEAPDRSGMTLGLWSAPSAFCYARKPCRPCVTGACSSSCGRAVFHPPPPWWSKTSRSSSPWLAPARSFPPRPRWVTVRL